MSSPILQGKHAVVFGAAGSVGAAVAKEFAAEGAEVFLAGRTKASVDAMAREIKAAGGKAHAAAVDALDEAAVTAYVDASRRRPAGSTSCSTPSVPGRRTTATGRTSSISPLRSSSSG